MSRDTSLIHAYLLDGKGGGKKMKWEDIESWTPEQGLLWVHLNFNVQRTAQWLNKKSGLDKLVIRALLVDESRPRSVVNSKGLLVVLRGVNSNPQQDPEDMISIRIWLSESCIITTRRRPLLSVGDICASIDDGLGPKIPSEFLIMLNERLTDRMASVLEPIDDQVDALEEQVLIAESHLLRPQLADIRRLAITLRRYLAPQREALNKLSYEESPLLNHMDRVHMREATDRIVRYIEVLDSARERAAITQEELTSRLSEQMDKRMYILSIVAVVFLPLSFITGLLGINVGGIPGADNQWAFAIVCFLSFFIIGISFYLLHKKRWI